MSDYNVSDYQSKEFKLKVFRDFMSHDIDIVFFKFNRNIIIESAIKLNTRIKFNSFLHFFLSCGIVSLFILISDNWWCLLSLALAYIPVKFAINPYPFAPIFIGSGILAFLLWPYLPLSCAFFVLGSSIFLYDIIWKKAQETILKTMFTNDSFFETLWETNTILIKKGDTIFSYD